MNFYTLSEGVYSDIDEIIVYRKDKASNKEFVQMCREVVNNCTNDYVTNEDVADGLCEHYGFHKVVSQLHIASGYSDFTGIHDFEAPKHDHMDIDTFEI